MKEDYMKFLACPECKGELDLMMKTIERGEVKGGSLRCRSCNSVYLIQDFVPRFCSQGSHNTNNTQDIAE